MISPEWFFSTLAQASAASIGFVIAFSAALYTSRRSRQRNKVNKFKGEIEELRQEIERPLKEMQDLLYEYGDFEREYKLYRDIEEDTSLSIRDWAEEQPTPETAYLWINLGWINWLLGSIDRENNALKMKGKLSELETPIIDSYTVFDTVPDEFRDSIPNYQRLYEELTRMDDSAPEAYNSEYNIFGTQHYLDRFLSKHKPGRSSEGTLAGWTEILEIVTDEYYRLDSRKYFEGLKFENEDIGSVLRNCKILFLISVVVPMLFLLTIPLEQTLDWPLLSFLIPLMQFIVLSITGYFGWRLFDDLMSLVKSAEF